MIKTLGDFVGNSETMAIVRSWISSGRVPQAIVIEGPEQSGRKTLARLIAAGLICSAVDRNSAPCGDCPVCRKTFTGHPDVVFVRGDLSKAAIGVDVIRELKAAASILPNESDRKTFIISRQMTDAAQNSFLKLLEDPPQGVTFIIIAASREELLDTVCSRAFFLTLSAVNREVGIEFLRRRFPSTAEIELCTAFEKSGGLLGKAEQILAEDGSGDTAEKLLSLAARAVAEKDPAGFLSAVSAAENSPKLLLGLPGNLMLIFRDAYWKKEAAKGGMSGFEDEALQLSRRLTSAQLADMIECLRTAAVRASENPKGSLFLAWLCARLFKCMES